MGPFSLSLNRLFLNFGFYRLGISTAKKGQADSKNVTIFTHKIELVAKKTILFFTNLLNECVAQVQGNIETFNPAGDFVEFNFKSTDNFCGALDRILLYNFLFSHLFDILV